MPDLALAAATVFAAVGAIAVCAFVLGVLFERWRHDKVLHRIREVLIGQEHLFVFEEMSKDERGRHVGALRDAERERLRWALDRLAAPETESA